MDATGVLVNVSQLIQILLLLGKDVCKPSNLLIPCLKLLQPLVEEIQKCSSLLDDTSFVLFLESVLQGLVQAAAGDKEGSSRVARVIQCEDIEKSFLELTSALQQSLSSIPLDHISEEGRSLAEACVLELKKAKYHVDISDLVLRNEIQTLLMELRERQHVRPEKLLKLFDKLGITSDEALSKEMDALEIVKEQARADRRKSQEELFDRVITMFMQMVRYSPDGLQTMPELARGLSIPSDFRCPLCLELMGDPVIIASGQTYERAYIQQWLDQGNTTCPKTRKILAHSGLTPNYTVKALISNWCESNDVPLPTPAKLSTSLPMRKLSLIQRKDVDHDQGDEGSFVSGKISSSPRSVRTLRAKSCRGYPHRGSPLGAASPNHDWCFASSKSCPVVDDNIRSSPSASSGSSEDHSPEDGLATPRTLDASINLSDYSPYNSASDVSGDFERMTSMLRVSGGGGSPAGSFRRQQHHSPAHSFPSLMSRPSGGRSAPLQRGRRPPSVAAATARHTSDAALQVIIENSMEDLKSDCVEMQLTAARELRLLAKHDDENRVLIAKAGAIPPLVSLLDSPDRKVQENAITAILNLSLDDKNKAEIAASGAIDQLVKVLTVGSSEGMENAAAALMILSVLDDNKSVIGASGAIPPLVELLNDGSFRGKKDAATALYNLSQFSDNKATIVNAGAVNAFVKLIKEPTSGMVDKAVVVLANLMTVSEGRNAISEGGGIQALVEVVEAGTPRGKEYAAVALLHLCTNSTRHRTMVLQEGAIPPLHALSQSGTPRAKEKASALLRHFREQRQSSFGSSRSQPQILS